MRHFFLPVAITACLKFELKGVICLWHLNFLKFVTYNLLLHWNCLSNFSCFYMKQNMWDRYFIMPYLSAFKDLILVYADNYANSLRHCKPNSYTSRLFHIHNRSGIFHFRWYVKNKKKNQDNCQIAHYPILSVLMVSFKFDECLISKIKIVKDNCFKMDNGYKRGQKIDNLKKKFWKIMLNGILIKTFFFFRRCISYYKNVYGWWCTFHMEWK